MKIIQETTQWQHATANSLYLVTDNMEYIIAYVPEGSTKSQRFRKPIRWDPRGRQFKVLKDIVEKDSNTRRITGSKGQVYSLTRHNGTWTCTCPGYAFRGQCKHVTEQV